MKNVIVMQREDQIQVWGCMTKICLYNPGFKYHSLKGKKFPFNYKGWRFVKVPYLK